MIPFKRQKVKAVTVNLNSLAPCGLAARGAKLSQSACRASSRSPRRKSRQSPGSPARCGPRRATRRSERLRIVLHEPEGIAFRVDAVCHPPHAGHRHSRRHHLPAGSLDLCERLIEDHHAHRRKCRGGGSTTGLPVIQDLRREIVSFQSVIRWNLVAEYEPGAFGFGPWCGLASPVDTSGPPDQTVAYVSGQGEHRATRAQTEPEYTAVAAYTPTEQAALTRVIQVSVG